MSETRVEDETTEAGGKGAKVKVCGIPDDELVTEFCGAKATDTMLFAEPPPET